MRVPGRVRVPLELPAQRGQVEASVLAGGGCRSCGRGTHLSFLPHCPWPGCSLDDNGAEFPVGQIWSPGDPCELCICQVNGNLRAFSCFPSPCSFPAPRAAPHPHPSSCPRLPASGPSACPRPVAPGTCCPRLTARHAVGRPPQGCRSLGVAGSRAQVTEGPVARVPASPVKAQGGRRWCESCGRIACLRNGRGEGAGFRAGGGKADIPSENHDRVGSVLSASCLPSCCESSGLSAPGTAAPAPQPWAAPGAWWHRTSCCPDLPLPAGDGVMGRWGCTRL